MLKLCFVALVVFVLAAAFIIRAAEVLAFCYALKVTLRAWLRERDERQRQRRHRLALTALEDMHGWKPPSGALRPAQPAYTGVLHPGSAAWFDNDDGESEACPYCDVTFYAPRGHDPLKRHLDFCPSNPNGGDE